MLICFKFVLSFVHVSSVLCTDQYYQIKNLLQPFHVCARFIYFILIFLVNMRTCRPSRQAACTSNSPDCRRLRASSSTGIRLKLRRSFIIAARRPHPTRPSTGCRRPVTRSRCCRRRPPRRRCCPISPGWSSARPSTSSSTSRTTVRRAAVDASSSTSADSDMRPS